MKINRIEKTEKIPEKLPPKTSDEAQLTKKSKNTTEELPRDTVNISEEALEASKKERLANLIRLFDEAEVAFTAHDREAAKPFLNKIYASLIVLNKSKEQVPPLAQWNPSGDLTEAQFNELNLRRRKLSNALGIMTASGVVRHDLNKI